jgi:hypothetical protein
MSTSILGHFADLINVQGFKVFIGYMPDAGDAIALYQEDMRPPRLFMGMSVAQHFPLVRVKVVAQDFVAGESAISSLQDFFKKYHDDTMDAIAVGAWTSLGKDDKGRSCFEQPFKCTFIA